MLNLHVFLTHVTIVAHFYMIKLHANILNLLFISGLQLFVFIITR